MFEKNVLRLLKEFESEERFQLMNETLKNPATFHDNQDFHTSLSKYVLMTFPNSYANSSERNINSPSKERFCDIDMQSDKPFNQINSNEPTIITEINDI